MQPAPPETNAMSSPRTPRGAIVAVVCANIALAFGPWFVRMADTGPVAAAFWRIALALPVLLLMAGWSDRRALLPTRALLVPLLIGGVAFAIDLGSWHIGIRRTTMANATLFGNSAILIYPLYGFIAARAWPSRTQGVALLLAAIGAGLLMGRSYQLDPRNLAGDLLCILAGVLYTVYIVLMARVRGAMRPLPALSQTRAIEVLRRPVP